MEFDINNKETALPAIVWIFEHLNDKYDLDIVFVFASEDDVSHDHNVYTIGTIKDGKLDPLFMGHFSHVLSYVSGMKDCADLLRGDMK